MKILIGAPIYKRAWILDEWFKHIEKQSVPLEDLGFVFELGADDDETHNKLWEWHQAHPEVSVFDGVVRGDLAHGEHPENGRLWSRTSYWRMVDLRNSLLEKVRVHQPDRYFSLDSDILLEDPETIEKLYYITEEEDAAGTLSYMTPTGRSFPSVMTWRNRPGGPAFRDLKNYPIGTVYRADVIMASKMMTSKVYGNCHYMWHKQGEDLGWSWNCHDNGVRFVHASNIYTAHVMNKTMLPDYLENGDPRSTYSNNNSKV